MNIEELLISDTERIEWKETDRDANDIFHSICALANDLSNSQQSGYLVIGVNKNGIPVGLDERELDTIQKNLTNRLSSTKLLPTPSVDIRVAEHVGKYIVAAVVEPYAVPPVVTVNQTAWVRKGSVTQRAREADLLRLKERRPENNQPFDIRIQKDTSLEDLETGPLMRSHSAMRWKTMKIPSLSLTLSNG